MLKCEEYAIKAMKSEGYREAISYLNRLMEACPNSVRHVSMLLESMIGRNPNDMTECVQYSTKV